MRPEQLGDSERPQGCWKSNLWVRLFCSKSPLALSPLLPQDRGLSWGGRGKQRTSVGGGRRLPAPSMGLRPILLFPEPTDSGTKLPLDEGDAVVSLASQWGVAEAAQVLPQLDKGLLHGAPGGWGGRAGAQQRDSDMLRSQAGSTEGLPRLGACGELNSVHLCVSPSSSRFGPGTGSWPDAGTELRCRAVPGTSVEHGPRRTPRNSSRSLRINSAPLPRRGGGRGWHGAREETVTATGLEDGWA